MTANLKERGVANTEMYLQAQKQFWNVDERQARFGRVDTVSSSEEEYERLADRDIDLVLKHVTLRPGSTIIEIGCGVGRLLTRFVSRVHGAKLIGVDISENMIQYARNALEHVNNVELLVNSGRDLSIVGDATVDFVYSNDVFIHIHDIDIVRRYLLEIRRVLKRRGTFRFNTRRMDISRAFSNSPGGIAAKTAYLMGFLSVSSECPEPGFSGIAYRKRDLRRLTSEAGLSLITIEPFDGPDERKFWCTCLKG